MEKQNLSKLIEDENEKERSSTELILDAINKHPLRDRVHGLNEVQHKVYAALVEAAAISKYGRVPILLLIGPTGSGKTEIINTIKKSYYDFIREGGELKTISINGEKCPYKENPYNVFRSALPFTLKGHNKIRDDRINNRKSPEVCSACRNRLEDLMPEKNNISEIELKPVYPHDSIVELDDPDLTKNFFEAVKEANRGILVISADKSKLNSVNPATFQFFSDMADNNLSDRSGKKIPLDMLVIIHANEGFIDGVAVIDDDELRDFKPLRDRIIRVDVRRNLSYSEEKKIYDEIGVSSSHLFPSFLDYIARANVLSRINISEDKIENYINEDKKRRMSTLLGILDMYDSNKLASSANRLTSCQGELMDMLISLDNNKKGIESGVLNLILSEDRSGYESGWSRGASTRDVHSILRTIHEASLLENKKFGFAELEAYMSQYLGGDELSYMKEIIVSDIRTKIDYGLLSFNLEQTENGLEYYKSFVEKYLNYVINRARTSGFNAIDPKMDEGFKDPDASMDVLSKYMDIGKFKSNINAYCKFSVPIVQAFNADLHSFLEFCITYGDGGMSLVKKNNDEVLRGLEDKRSKLYSYMRDKHFEGSDDYLKQCVKVYKTGELK